MKLKFSVPENIDKSRPHIILATWLYSGFMNPAPGTWGSLAALPFGALIFYLGGASGLLFAVIAVTTIGLWAAQKYDEDAEGHDSKMIVIDEVAGQWLAMVAAGLNPTLILLAFIFFRVFDITKPFPVYIFDQKIKGSAGVMGDDLVAGFMAFICVAAVGWLMF